MININTIISSFDKEGTLLKWLKKVEDALKNASLKTVETVTIDDTSFQLKFVFADDTFLLSPTITGPKGAKGETGPQGPVGPQGDTGPQGPAGKDATITAENVNEVMEGSSDIVVDMNETNDKVVVRLDDTFKNKLANKDELLDNATLEVKKASDGVPTINLVAEFGNKTKVNSSAQFDRTYFDVENGHISFIPPIGQTLYIHIADIHTPNYDANIVFLNTVGQISDTPETLAAMLSIENYYCALLTGTIFDKKQSKSFQINDFNVTEPMGGFSLYYIDSDNQKRYITVEYNDEIIDSFHELL